MALACAAIGYELREVSLRSKPAAMIQASEKGTVPVLVLPVGRVIDESLDIMRWALAQHDPQNWLASEAKHCELIAINDGQFKFHLDRMKYSTRYPGADSTVHRIEALKLLMPLEQQLSCHAYLFGETPTLPDVAIFPFVRQFAQADAAAFANEPLPALQAWLATWESSVLFQSVMVKHPIWTAD
jgi:glutathione S-transferase